MHGYLADNNSFIYQKAFLSQYFKVFSPDFKGFGENKNMEYPYSLNDYANDIKDYLIKNDIKKPSVIAHSFGARVVVKLASENDNLFDKIVLTGGAGLKPRFKLKKAIKVFIFKILKKFIKKEKLTKFYSSDYNKLSPVMKESFKMVVNEHLDKNAKLIKNKTLLIYGKNDFETPVYMGVRYNKLIKNSKLSIYNNAGHFAFLDSPKKFNLEVREFLLP